jgi:5S rRNA maturation endonuclease (ribonuclease M5)
MKKEQALQFLKLLGWKPPVDQPRAGWAVGPCPLGPWNHDNGKSHNDAFGIKIEQGDSFCYCFACDYHGSQSDLVMTIRHKHKHNPAPYEIDFAGAMQLIADAEDNLELAGLSAPSFEEMFTQGDRTHLFDEKWLESFQHAYTAPWAAEYLEERGVSQQIALMLDIRADLNQQRVCFPVRDFKGRLVGLHGRAVHDDTEPRYRMYLHHDQNNPIFWLGEKWIDTTKPIVVVEGPFDLASVYRVYRNVTSPLFANPSQQKLKRMSDAQEWITLYDNGKGGDTGRAKVSKAMKKHLITHLKPPEGSKDPGTMSIPELVDLLEPHVTLDPILT